MADVVRDVHEVLDRMSGLAERVRSGNWLGHTGRRVRAVVNIGIGGFDPRSGDGVPGARRPFRPRPDPAVRLERRRDRPGGVPPRPRSVGDPRDRLLEDVHHHRDDDEMRAARGSGCSTGSAATRARSRSTSSRSPPTFEAVAEFGIDPANAFGPGTGWRPLLDGLGAIASTMVATGPDAFHDMLASSMVDVHWQ